MTNNEQKLQAENLKLKEAVDVLRKAILDCKRFASHKPNQEISFFRYLHSSAGENACADDAVWGHLADNLESLTKAEEILNDKT